MFQSFTCFSYSWHSPKGCAMHPTLLKASNIVCIENLIISYHFKCQGTFHAFTKFGPQFNIYQPPDLTATGIIQSSLSTQANEYLPWMKCSEHTRAPSYGACFLLSATSHLRRRSSSRGNFDGMRKYRIFTPALLVCFLFSLLFSQPKAKHPTILVSCEREFFTLPKNLEFIA